MYLRSILHVNKNETVRNFITADVLTFYDKIFFLFFYILKYLCIYLCKYFIMNGPLFSRFVNTVYA